MWDLGSLVEGAKGCLKGRREEEWERRRMRRVTYFVAMPEQRARVLRATRSPRRMLRIGPRTVAQWVMGVIVVPSGVCHSTLMIAYQYSPHSC